MDNTEIRQQILDVLEGNDLFHLVSHRRMDFDALGSCLALKRYLEEKGKQAFIFCRETMSPVFLDLLGDSEIIKGCPDPKGAVLIILDVAQPDRLSTRVDLSAYNYIVNIDHHQGAQGLGSLNWIDPQSGAVCEMIYRLIRDDDEYKITDGVADPLLTGLLSDTGRFGNAGFHADHLLIAYELISSGADFLHIVNQRLNVRTPAEYRLLRDCMKLVEFSDGGEFACMVLPLSIADSHGLNPEDTVRIGLFPQVMAVKGVRIGVFIMEAGPEKVFVEFRSHNEDDVAELAERLGGGGHKNASGCLVSLRLWEAVERIGTLTRKHFGLT